MDLLLPDLPDTSSQLRAIFQASSDLLFILDNGSRILDYKAGDPGLLHAAPEAFLGKRIQDILPFDAAETVTAAIQRAKVNKEPVSFNYSLTIKDRRLWFDARLVGLPPDHILVLVRDITNHKGAVEQAKRQLEQLAALRSIDLAITSNLDLEAMLLKVLSQVAAQLKIDAADILLLAVPQQTLEFAAGVGFRSSALRHTRLPIGEGYAGLAVLQQEMISIPDLPQRGAGFLRSPDFSREEFACYYGVPLISKGQARGVLELFHRAPLDPDPEWLEYMQILSGQAAIAIDNAMLFNQLQSTNRELTEAYDMVIEGWSRALDLRDRDTEGHTQRVTEMALDLARYLAVEEARLVHIRRGAILHDIGKMAIPDSILLKPAPLSGAEWDVMKQHPRYARELLSPMPFLAPAIDIPHFHHEKWDGTGYPDGLKGETIPLIARLFAVVDVFDALTSDRPYRPAWARRDALDYIRAQAGIHFDPGIARRFVDMIRSRN